MDARMDTILDLLSLKKVLVHGLVNFDPAVAYLFCLNLPAAFSQPRTKTSFGLCITDFLLTYAVQLSSLQARHASQKSFCHLSHVACNDPPRD